MTKTGINTFIVPKSLNYVAKWEQVRNFIASSMYLLVDCSKAWDYVLLEMVIFARKKDNITSAYSTHFLENSPNNTPTDTMSIDKSLINLFGIFPCNLTQKELEIGIKVRTSVKTSLNDIAQCFRGGSFQKDTKGSIDGEYYEVLGGKQIQRYTIQGIKGFVSKTTKTSNESNVRDNSILLQRIISHIENPTPHIKFTATIPKNKNYKIVNTIFQIICKDGIPNSYILGILHSKLMNWYCYRFAFSKAIRSMDFSNEIASKIPIPKITKSNKTLCDKIIALVDRILDSKALDSTTDTSELESKIDKLVYKLYNLTESEAEII